MRVSIVISRFMWTFAISMEREGRKSESESMEVIITVTESTSVLIP